MTSNGDSLFVPGVTDSQVWVPTPPRHLTGRQKQHFSHLDLGLGDVVTIVDKISWQLFRLKKEM